METILFENYQKYQKEHRENLFREFFKLPVIVIIMLAALIISAILGVITIFIKSITFMFPYAVIIEIALFIVIYFYTDQFRIKTSDNRLTQYAAYCSEIANWLKSTGFVFTQNNVKQLIVRVSIKLDKIESERLKRKETIEKWFQILIIPVLLAVFSQVIRNLENITDLITFTVAILAFASLFGLSALSVNSVVELFRKRRIEQLRGFVDDLQGILDTQFADKLFDVNDKAMQEMMPCTQKEQYEKMNDSQSELSNLLE